MKMTLHFEAESLSDLVAKIRGMADLMESGAVVTKEEETKDEAVKKRGRPAKATAEAEVDEDFDLGETEDTEEESEPEHTIEDVIDAFKTYAKKHSREKAAKVLGKFKVKSVRDLKPADFAAVLKTLGA